MKTELMERYKKDGGRYIESVGRGTYGKVDFYKLYTSYLEGIIKKLESQLTWRPVSEKPEKDGRYFAEVKPYTGCESTIITTAYFDGERFLWHDVVRWLPIPPAPEA